MRISRRAVLAWAGFGVASAAVAGGIAGLALETDVTLRRFVEVILSRRLPGVTIRDGDVAAFAEDFVASRHADHRIRLLSLAGGAPAEALEMARIHSENYEIYERAIVSDFLMSSNFFSLSDPTRQVVEYRGLSPRLCAGANPFARFVDDPRPA